MTERERTLVLVSIEMLETAGVEAGRAANDTVDLVPLLEKQLRPTTRSAHAPGNLKSDAAQIRSILTRDACRSRR